MSSEPELNAVQRAAADQFSKQSHRYGKGHVLEDISDVRLALEALATLDPKANFLSGQPAPVLDVAAGAGHTGLFLAGLGHAVILADISAAMLERCAEAAKARGLSVQIQQCSAEQLPFREASFKLITCRVAAHHFSSVPKFLREINRVLVPGGWFLLIDGSIEDGQPEAEAWIHRVEKLRDPSHGRFISIGEWRGLCEDAGLEVRHAVLQPFKQPDLEWYFETAATPAQNRSAVLKLVDNAPSEARALFKLGTEDGKIVWWWQRLMLLAHKAL